MNPGQPHEKPTLHHSARPVSCNIGEKILYLYIMRSRGQNNPCSKLKSLYTIILRIGNYTLYSKGITDLHASGGTLSLESRALASDERLSVPPRACKSVIPFE